MQSRLLLLTFFLLLAGCKTVGPENRTPIDLPYTPINAQAEYVLNRGDVLEIVYQIQNPEQSDYKLRFRDVIAINYPSTPELNSVQTIRPDGKISLPYLNEFRVVGLTPQEASESIRSSYKGILNKPDVFVEVKEFGASLEDLKLAVSSASRGQSRLATVRPDGLVTLPMLGDVPVAGRTLKQISEQVNSAYGARFPGVKVDILLDQLAVSNAYVFGEVLHPGGFRLTEPVTPLELLAMSGGGTIDAVLSDVLLLKKDRARSEIVCTKVDLKRMLKLKPGDKIPLIEQGDMLYVPRMKITDIAHVTQTLAAIVLFNGQSVSYNYRMNDDNNNY